MNKKVLIGLGVLTAVGIGLYMWKRRKDGEKSSDEKLEKKYNATSGTSCSGDKYCYKASCGGSGYYCNNPKPINNPTTNISGVDGCNSCPHKNQCPRYLKSVDNNAPIFQGRRVASVATPYIPNNVYYGADGYARPFKGNVTMIKSNATGSKCPDGAVYVKGECIFPIRGTVNV